jgi:mannose-6-phosphate isomerase-like protein (cupin superfamily)
MPTKTATEKRWFIRDLATIHPASTALSLVEMVGPVGDMPPLHLHRNEDEVFFIVEGEISVFVGPNRFHLTAGESACVARGVPHTYRVESESARWLAICAPAGFDRFVAAASEPAAADELPPPDREVDPGALARIAAEYGIEILGPPGALPE